MPLYVSLCGPTGTAQDVVWQGQVSGISLAKRTTGAKAPISSFLRLLPLLLAPLAAPARGVTH